MNQVIITAPCHEFLIQSLETKGIKVFYEPTISYEGLILKIENFEGLVVTTRLKIDKKIIDKAEKLKWIGRLGSGMELIDMEYANKKNIACISTPQGNAQAVAEHAVGMLLCLMNKIPISFEEVKNKKWIREDNRGEEIQGKIIGIIGYGNTGSAFAKCISGFQPKKILVVDKYKTNFDTPIIQQTDLENLLSNADILSIHLPLTIATKHFINTDFIKKIKKNIYLINTSRGEIINTIDILNANRENKFKGLLLDVLENEKLDTLSETEAQTFETLAAMKNIIITPHIAGYSKEAYFKMASFLFQSLIESDFI